MDGRYPKETMLDSDDKITDDIHFADIHFANVRFACYYEAKISDRISSFSNIHKGKIFG